VAAYTSPDTTSRMQLLGALPVRVDKRRPLDDEVAVPLEHEEDVERVLLTHDLLSMEQRVIGGVEPELLLYVPAHCAYRWLRSMSRHATARPSNDLSRAVCFVVRPSSTSSLRPIAKPSSNHRPKLSLLPLKE
jgi:hypothetical protein